MNTFLAGRLVEGFTITSSDGCAPRIAANAIERI